MNVTTFERGKFIRFAVIYKRDGDKDDFWRDTFYMVSPLSITMYAAHEYERDGEKKIGTNIWLGSGGFITPLPIDKVDAKVNDNNAIYSVTEKDDLL